ncbi:MAG: lipocalin family protein [Alphaproteobacteria bacterium]|nr:lipocalin family protein [Alphaproteobacteria bacterium]
MKAAAALALLAMTTISAFAAAPKAPEPARPVDAASFFAGRWYEIGRTPKSFNAGCVAGVTDYQSKDGGIFERDACHDKTPDGKEESIGGPLKILNPGTNTKVDVTYRALGGLFPIHREYWVLDHGDSWFMIANPEMTEVNLYTREPRPAQVLVDRMTKQIKDLGYAGPLEFPTLSAAKP